MNNYVNSKIKYGMSNNEYRILKDMAMIEFDLRILEISRLKYVKKIRKKDLDINSKKMLKFEKITTSIKNSKVKKENKLSELAKELRDLKTNK